MPPPSVRERDKITEDSARFVVAVASRGRIALEGYSVHMCRALLDMAPGMNNDGYAIYTRDEWERLQ